MTVGQLITTLQELEDDIPTTVDEVSLIAQEDEGGFYNDEGEFVEGESTIAWLVRVN
jgi:hypothetical protein